MNSKSLVLVVFCIECLYAFETHVPEVEWQHTYGGSDGELCTDVCLVQDGGYVVVGITESFMPEYDPAKMYVVRTNCYGDTLWTKSIRLVNGINRVFSVQQTDDEGFILTGSAHGNVVLLFKLDPDGHLVWFRDYILESSGIRGYAVIQTTDKGFIILCRRRYASSRGEDIYIIRTDNHGDTLWTSTYGNGSIDQGRSIQPTSDGGYIITGCTNSTDSIGTDLLLLKTDGNGNITWARNYGGDSYETGTSVIQTMDGGYIATGSTESYGAGGNDIYIVRTTYAGDTLWTRAFGGTYDDFGNALIETSPGRFLVAVTSPSSNESYSSIYLIRIDDNGDTLWTTTVGEGLNSCSGLFRTLDGGFILAGNTYSFERGTKDFYMIKLAPMQVLEEPPEIGDILSTIASIYSDRICSCMMISYYSFRQFIDSFAVMELFDRLAACYGLKREYESTVDLRRAVSSL